MTPRGVVSMETNSGTSVGIMSGACKLVFYLATERTFWTRYALLLLEIKRKSTLFTVVAKRIGLSNYKQGLYQLM